MLAICPLFDMYIVCSFSLSEDGHGVIVHWFEYRLMNFMTQKTIYRERVAMIAYRVGQKVGHYTCLYLEKA